MQLPICFTVLGSSCSDTSNCTVRGDTNAICNENTCKCRPGYFNNENDICEKSKQWQ